LSVGISNVIALHNAVGVVGAPTFPAPPGSMLTKPSGESIAERVRHLIQHFQGPTDLARGLTSVGSLD